MTKSPMTAAGYSALQDELNQRMAVERPRLVQRMHADAFALMTRDRPDALFVAYHPTNYVNRQRIADFGIAQRIPGMVPYREATMAGGLMSYGVSVTGQYRRVAGLVDKILKGAKPADIPVERPTRLELVINLATAKALGLDLPPTLLDRADAIIE